MVSSSLSLDLITNLVNCFETETGHADWDRVTLKKLAGVVDYHSIHSDVLRLRLFRMGEIDCVSFVCIQYIPSAKANILSTSWAVSALLSSFIFIRL